jgi:hypothetical protein
MTHDDSVQIEAASPARGRALPCVRRRERASRTRGWETSPIPAMAERGPRGRGDRRRDRMGNFPPCKALKKHKMGKESRYRASPLCSQPNVSLQRGRRGARFASLTIRAFSTRLDRRRESPAGSIAIVDPTVAATARRKLSPSQSLENSQNGKIISISREPFRRLAERRFNFRGDIAANWPSTYDPAGLLRLRLAITKRDSNRSDPFPLYGAKSSCGRSSPLSLCMPIDGKLSP